MSTLTIKEKAKLYDEIRKLAEYDEPSYGYHNGGWTIHVQVKGDKDCPRNFTTALKRMIGDKDD